MRYKRVKGLTEKGRVALAHLATGMPSQDAAHLAGMHPFSLSRLANSHAGRKRLESLRRAREREAIAERVALEEANELP